jgi:hypothetical protein
MLLPPVSIARLLMRSAQAAPEAIRNTNFQATEHNSWHRQFAM